MMCIFHKWEFVKKRWCSDCEKSLFVCKKCKKTKTKDHLYSNPPCLFHKFRAIDLHKDNYITCVLYKCERCERVKHVNVDGYWTLEQIKGESK
jgi:hypothetical protein